MQNVIGRLPQEYNNFHHLFTSFPQCAIYRCKKCNSSTDVICVMRNNDNNSDQKCTKCWIVYLDQIKI
jgi:hypothetical protein